MSDEIVFDSENEGLYYIGQCNENQGIRINSDKIDQFSYVNLIHQNDTIDGSTYNNPDYLNWATVLISEDEKHINHYGSVCFTLDDLDAIIAGLKQVRDELKESK